MVPNQKPKASECCLRRGASGTRVPVAARGLTRFADNAARLEHRTDFGGGADCSDCSDCSDYADNAGHVKVYPEQKYGLRKNATKRLRRRAIEAGKISSVRRGGVRC